MTDRPITLPFVAGMSEEKGNGLILKLVRSSSDVVIFFGGDGK
jgi:hypothetical protein